MLSELSVCTVHTFKFSIPLCPKKTTRTIRDGGVQDVQNDQLGLLETGNTGRPKMTIRTIRDGGVQDVPKDHKDY